VPRQQRRGGQTSGGQQAGAEEERDDRPRRTYGKCSGSAPEPRGRTRALTSCGALRQGLRLPAEFGQRLSAANVYLSRAGKNAHYHESILPKHTNNWFFKIANNKILSTLCLLLPIWLMLGHGRPLGAMSSAEASPSSFSRHRQEFEREMADLLIVSPPFAPTRRPSKLTASQPAENTDASSVASSKLRMRSGTSMEPEHRMGRSKGGKFVRVNEFDTFLDELSNGELGAIAAGKPIEDLFHAKPAVRHAETGHPLGYANGTRGGHSEGELRGATLSAGAQNVTSGGQNLMASHSEQQIYSECALILQRTYVKSLDQHSK